MGAVHPRLLRLFSTFTYSTITNLFVGFGLAMHGFAERQFCMWGGVPFLIPGVNGGSSHALKALSTQIAGQEGYGNGEFAGWMSNMRALIQSIQIVFLGMWYARCGERGTYQGSTWWLASLVGAVLPQLLMLTMPYSEFEPPKAKEPKEEQGAESKEK